MESYYTVAEYAKHLGKDPGNIRRMLISGRLEGSKLGNQWVIKAGTPYPEDKRVRSGKYYDWRKRTKFISGNHSLQPMLEQLVVNLCKIYGDRLERVVLYGSYARGTQTAESDIDIALLLKSGHTEKMHEKMISMAVDLELENDRVLSIVPIDYEEYTKWKNIMPFYKSIRKEGITLWKAA